MKEKMVCVCGCFWKTRGNKEAACPKCKKPIKVAQ